MSDKKWKLCFVCPRYRTDHAGGAEILTEKVAKEMADRGHRVEVFTTCAQDHYTWKNYYRPGTFKDGNITVSRFPVDEDRDTVRFLRIQKKIDFKIDLEHSEELDWINGSVHSRDLYNALDKRRKQFDWFIFAPYLFGITYRGSMMLPEKSLLIPCLHDEPFAYLSIFREMFDQARGILFNSVPEKELAQRIYSLNNRKCALAGMGFDIESGKHTDCTTFLGKYGLIDKPYILYAGRREPGKNTPLLVEYVHAYNNNNRDKIWLILIGTGEVKIPSGAEHYIQDLGFLSAEEKDCAYQSAAVFCQPSVNESLSIVIMESWLAGTPVMVNGKCSVTRHHCQHSNGGLYFDNFYEFEECVKVFLKNKKTADQLAVNGRRYVEEHYSWGKVISSIEGLFGRITRNAD